MLLKPKLIFSTTSRFSSMSLEQQQPLLSSWPRPRQIRFLAHHAAWSGKPALQLDAPAAEGNSRHWIAQPDVLARVKLSAHICTWRRVFLKRSSAVLEKFYLIVVSKSFCHVWENNSIIISWIFWMSHFLSFNFGESCGSWIMSFRYMCLNFKKLDEISHKLLTKSDDWWDNGQKLVWSKLHETFTKIYHQLVLCVKEKEQIDELRHTQAKLAEATESLGKQISEIENEHKDRNRSFNI